jgi:hypothetical protein
MASYGKVVGGQFVNATININRKGELALSPLGLKRTPNLTSDAVAAWEEIISDSRGGAAGAISKVGQAVSRAALPGAAGKAASAAVGSTVDSMGGTPHTVRVDWIAGEQSLIRLPDKLFQHLAILLKDCQIESVAPPAPTSVPPAPGVIGHLTQLAGAVRTTQPDVTEQIAKFATLRDQGAITEDEFAAKKADLLGLATPGVEPATVTAPQPGPPPPASPPVWAPDPHGRHDLRYWDGSVWTDHVSTGGVQTTDPA